MPVPLGRVAAGRSAVALPDPLPALAKSKYGVKFHRGELVMMAGPSGTGKTTMALILALATGRPCLYFSADSDDLTMAARAASVVTTHATSEVREAQENDMFSELYGEALKALNVRFVFDPSEPSIQDIENSLVAYYEIWGTYPEIVIVDNLWNTATEGGEEWSSLRGTVKDLHHVARRTKASLWLLHHTVEADEKWPTAAPPRAAIQGKLSQLPALIVTLGLDEAGVMWMAVVKWRHGQSDPKALFPIRIQIDFAHNRILPDWAPQSGAWMVSGMPAST